MTTVGEVEKDAVIGGKRIVDVHHHVFPQALVQAYRQRDSAPRMTEVPGLRGIRLPNGAMGTGESLDMGPGMQSPLSEELLDPELHLRDMDRGGIDLAVLSVSAPSIDALDTADAVVVARECNDELAELVRRYPDRFAATAVVPLRSADGGVSELERAVNLGLRGVGVLSNVDGLHLADECFQDLFAAAAQLDVPFVLHPTTPVHAAEVDDYALLVMIGFHMDTTACALRLVFSGMFERHPDLKFVLPHMGAVLPFILGRLDHEAEIKFPLLDPPVTLSSSPSEQIRRFYLDTACLWRPAVEMGVSIFGAEHMMVGTDYPYWTIEPSLALAEETDLTPDQRTLISHGTADRVFGLGSPVTA